MNKKQLIAAWVILSLFFYSSNVAQARGRGGYGSYRSSGYRSYKGSYKSYSPKIYSPKVYSPKLYFPKKSYKNYSNVINFSNKPERSPAKKSEFLRSKGYKRTPPGYEVDHIIPLSKGGADEPYNMQLLPKEIHKQKTKTEQSGN